MRKLGEGKRDDTKERVAKRSGLGRGKVLLDVVLMMIWVFCSIVVSQLLVGYLFLWILGRETFSQPVWTAAVSAVSYLLALGLIALVPAKLFKKWKTSRKELGLTDLPTWTDIGLAPIGFVVATILGSILVSAFSFVPWFDANQVQNTGFSIYMSGGERIIAFLILVVVAPIAEEVIFRGWLYGKMREKLLGRFSDRTSMIVSILLVSVLFGLVHFQWNVGVNVFALSVVLCGLREITGTIYASILTHMVKNGVAFYLVYVLGIA